MSDKPNETLRLYSMRTGSTLIGSPRPSVLRGSRYGVGLFPVNECGTMLLYMLDKDNSVNPCPPAPRKGREAESRRQA